MSELALVCVDTDLELSVGNGKQSSLKLDGNTLTCRRLYVKGRLVVLMAECLRIVCWLNKIHIKCLWKIAIGFSRKNWQTFVIHAGMESAISQSLKAVATLLNFSSVKRGKMHKRRSVVGAPTSKERGRVVSERFLFSFDSTRPSQYLWQFSYFIWSCAYAYRSWNIWTLTQPIRELIVKHIEPFLHVVFPHLLWTSS